MRAIKKMLVILTAVMIIAGVMAVVFRDELKVAAVKQYVKHYTTKLLNGATISDSEKKTISRKLGEMYGMAAEKIIPEEKISALWNDWRRNIGVWFFFLKNFFKEEVLASGMEVVARDKAVATLDKFLGYIKDGRVKIAHILRLNNISNLFEVTSSSVKGLKKEQVEKAVRSIGLLNEELEREGPGKALNPVERFKEIMEDVEYLIEKYKPGEKE